MRVLVFNESMNPARLLNIVLANLVLLSFQVDSVPLRGLPFQFEDLDVVPVGNVDQGFQDC